jgi:tetratricopeptide (TPR) repeat protein
MPKSAVRDAQHVVYTDHSIPRRPRPTAAQPDTRARLVLFGGGATSDRDLGLAYAIAGDRDRARPLLESASPDDREALAYLADIDRPHAEVLYRRVLALDPHNVTALVGLGALYYERGNFDEAIPLWRDAESRSPGLVLTRTNLAMAQWRSGDLTAARTTIERVLRLSPAFQPALQLRSDITRP